MENIIRPLKCISLPVRPAVRVDTLLDSVIWEVPVEDDGRLQLG